MGQQKHDAKQQNKYLVAPTKRFATAAKFLDPAANFIFRS